MSVLRALAHLRDDLAAIRAWPSADGSLTVEGRDAQGRVRAGRLDADGLSLVPPGQDRRLPALRLREGDELVVHRLHKRAVVRRDEAYLKVLRRGRAARVLTATRALAEPCRRAGLATADVLGADDDTITSATLPGRTLHDLGGAGLGGWSLLARAWPVLAASEADPGIHDGNREADTLHTWVGHAEAFGAFPVQTRTLRRTAEAVAGELADGPADRWGLLHRDLHDKQVLWDAGTGALGMLDLDTAARGEVALDLANLAVHLDLRCRQGVLSEADARQIRAVLAPVADAVGATEQRLAVYERSARLRLACVYAFRPDAAVWLGGWLDDALGG